MKGRKLQKNHLFYLSSMTSNFFMILMNANEGKIVSFKCCDELTKFIKIEACFVVVTHHFVDKRWKEGIWEASYCLTSATKPEIAIFLSSALITSERYDMYITWIIIVRIS